MANTRIRKFILDNVCQRLDLDINLDDETQLDPILFSKRAPTGESMIDMLAQENAFDLLIFLHEQYKDKLEALLFPNPESGNETEHETRMTHATYYIFKAVLLNLPPEFKKDEVIWKSYIRIFEKRLKPIGLGTVNNQSEESIRQELFGEKPSYTPLEIAVAKIKKLFFTPEQFIPYLQFIEREFNRYNIQTNGKPFPKLSSDKYRFVMIDGYEYPLPTAKFGEGISKMSVLQEFIMVLLRQVGWATADEAIQWMGPVPYDRANESLLENQGTFVTEGKMGEGLFHGKLSHMFHLAVVVLVIQDNLITGVTLQEIVDFLVHQASHEDPKVALWTKVFDRISKTNIYLGDPYRLHTMIMRHGEGDLGMPSIARYMIDTFCKGFNQAVKFKFQRNNEATEKAFLETLRYRQLNGFTGDSELLKKYVAAKDVKSRKEVCQYHGIFAKKYKPNKNFVPVRYQRNGM
jgi:hypothetical protein